MFGFETFWDLMRLLLSVASGVLAILPYGSGFHGSVAERWFFALSAAVVTFLLLPDNFAHCDEIAIHRRWAILFLLVAITFALAYIGIHRQFAYSQTSLRDDLKSTTTILGGPQLTDEATNLQNEHPELTSQEIFDRLGADPHRMWDRWSRMWLLLLHRATAMIAGLTTVAAVVSVCVGAAIAYEMRTSHEPLTLQPSSDQTILEGHRSIAIVPKLHECNQDLTWTIDGPANLKADVLGEVSPSGNYFAPSVISQDVDLYVIATPSEHPYEHKQVKILLRRHPEYSRPQYAVAEDSQQKQASFVIEVLDRTYSWAIGKNRLEGPDGATLVHRMAKDGIFNGVRQVIAIGAASREYTATNGDVAAGKDREENRALDRAQILGRWIRDAVGPGQDIWALKVGRYDEEVRLTAQETAAERQVVIVGVLKADKGIDILSALRSAFAAKRYDEPILGRYLDKYPSSHWHLARIEPLG